MLSLRKITEASEAPAAAEPYRPGSCAQAPQPVRRSADSPPNSKGCRRVGEILSTAGEHFVVAGFSESSQAGLANLEFQACSHVIAELVCTVAGDNLISG